MGAKKRIVLIEDNEADVVLIEEAVAAMSVPTEIRRFPDGVDALPALLEMPHADLPDLILLDLNMPRSEGLDVLKEIRNSPKLMNVPVAILTSSEVPSDRQRAVTIGATHYIHKPSSYDRFITTVGQAVEAMLREPRRK